MSRLLDGRRRAVPSTAANTGLGTPRKYQFMEQNLQRRVAGLRDKLPDIGKTLETVRFLKLRTVRRQRHPVRAAQVVLTVVLGGSPSQIRLRRPSS